MNNEIWRSIEGYEDLYECSNLGRVRSLINGGKILKPRKDKDGYEKVILYSNLGGKEFRLHRLIAKAFIENPDPENLTIVNHKNEIKDDNCVENLEWCSNKYNTNYGTRNEKISKSHKLNRTHHEISVSQYNKKTGKLIATYPSLREAERQTGVFHGNIKNAAERASEGRRINGKYLWKINENN